MRDDMGILDEKPQKALYNFLWKCTELRGVDVALVSEVATQTIKYLRGRSADRAQMRIAQVLEQRWYASLDAGSPDWSVYNTDYYMGELWACWIVYSRGYLRSLYRAGIVEDLSGIRGVVDLGCGFGYTTAALKEMFPSATVVGTNLEGTVQIELARRIAARAHFSIVPDIKDIATPVNFVFASEYFEHILEPILHLQEVIQRLQPRAFIIANAFGTRSIGHFDYYNVDGHPLDAKKTSKKFNDTLRLNGYSKVKTGLWNNRPTYWKRDE
jgi:SAM-dependent methyltransferase